MFSVRTAQEEMWFTSSVGFASSVTPFPSLSQTLVGGVRETVALGDGQGVGGGWEVFLRKLQTLGGQAQHAHGKILHASPPVP